MLEGRPGQCNQRQQEQHRQCGSCPGKRRAGDAELKSEGAGRDQILRKCARYNFVLSGPQSFHRKLGIVGKFLPHDLSRAIKQEKAILKLFGKSSSAGRGHIQHQTPLRILQAETRAQLIGLMHSLADDPRWAQCRCIASRFVASNAAAGANH